jgi:FOG: GGDEF domain
VARLGGDEFAIILPDLKELAIIDRIGHTLLERLQQPFELDGRTAHISASIGVALWPRDGRTPTELIHHADRAMYEAKRLGRNRLTHHARSATPPDVPAARRQAPEPPHTAPQASLRGRRAQVLATARLVMMRASTTAYPSG